MAQPYMFIHDPVLGPADAPFLADGGTTGALIRSMDWSKTCLGPIASWPRSLSCAVGMLIHSRHPMFLWWGPELIQFYNDAYLPSFGRGKHPLAMGQRGRDCWQEIWPIIFPQIDDAMRYGRASWNEDELVPIYRNDRLEEVYWTYGYSPLFGDDGNIAGTLVVCTETTHRVLATRRAEFVRRLSAELARTSSLAQVMLVSRQACALARLDIPFLLTYRQGCVDGPWQLTGSTHAAGENLERLDEQVRREMDNHPSMQRGSALPVAVHASFRESAWPEPALQALIAAPRTPGLESLVFGISPRLALDAAYREFIDQIVEQIDLAAARLDSLRVHSVIESERKNLLLQAPVATALLTGPRQIVALANSLYKDIIGDRDVVGRPYLEAFPEVAGTSFAAVLDHVYQTGEPFVDEEYFIPANPLRPGAEGHFYRFNLEPLRDAQGVVYGMMAVAVDITAQVNARRALEKTTADREKLLAQLEAANLAKDEFLATVSHELRTPLTSILGWAGILAEASDPERIVKGLAVIERNARAQAKLIEDILDVSRISSGKVRMSLRRVEPAVIVNAAVEAIRPLATAKRLRLLAHVVEPLGSLLADEDRLQQVVWNLLSNAVKFTNPGGEINVRAFRAESKLVIRVEDTGEGISRAFLPHVFDRFRQHDTSTTKRHSGLGLGLAIVRHLVELHGGGVVATSRGEGFGSTFEVSLPLTETEPRRSGTSGQASPEFSLMGSGATGRLRDVHVLVLDDEEDGRDLVSTILEDAGATVTQVGSVSAALQVLDAGSVAVVVSDIGMPGEDGYSFIQRLRASDGAARSPGLPALALTGFARAQDRQRALAAGFQEHISKPIAARRLIDIVAGLVHR
jgi:signal transduction histidine kinase/CheY-like chemotaxis protein